MKFQHQFIGATGYELDMTAKTYYHPQTGRAEKMLKIKRNDKVSFSSVLKDNFGRAVNLTGAKIKFIMTTVDDIFGPSEEEVVVSSMEKVSIRDQSKHRSAGEFSLNLDPEDTALAGKFRGEFECNIKGIVQNKIPGPYSLSDGQTLIIEVDGVEQTITFNTGDFQDISAATNAEVLAVIQAQLTGATATVLKLAEMPCYMLIYSDSENGSIAVNGGTAEEKFGFDSQSHSDQTITVPGTKLIIHIESDIDEAEEVDEDL